VQLAVLQVDAVAWQLPLGRLHKLRRAQLLDVVHQLSASIIPFAC